MGIFKFIAGFRYSEPWGNHTKMNGLLIMLMEKVRTAYKMRYDSKAVFHIHCGFEERGHAKKSQHAWPISGHGGYLGRVGNATDFHIQTTLTYAEQIEAMESIFKELQVEKVVGFGIYPDWNSPGFHLDVRGFAARWGRLGQTYMEYEDVKNIVKERQEVHHD